MFVKFFIRLLLVLSFSSSAYANALTDVSINSINYESLGSFQKSIQENLFDKNSIDSNANDIFKKISDKKLRQLNIDVLSGEFVSSEFLLNYEDFINNNFEFSYDVYTNSVDYLKEVNKYNANINYHLQTITTNSLAQQFSISTNFDVITSQSPEKILSSINIGPGYLLGAAATVVFVKDALDQGCTDPRLDISLSSSSMTEGGSTVTLTATIEKPLATNLVVPIATSGTATSGFDYQAITSITINAGDLTGTATITSVDDSQYESSTAETIIFTASNVQGSTCPGSTMTQTLALVDDDNAPTAQLSASASSIAEDAGSSIILTATLSNTTYEDVTLALGTSGTSTEGTDYTTISDITISAGSLSASTNFTPTNDTMYETATAETAIIDVTDVSGGNATESGTQQVSLSITADSDAAPTVTFASSASSVAENGSDLTITATLSNPTYETVTVTIDGTGGSATEGTDFATVSDITITSGNTTGTAAFNPTVDSLYDAASSEAAGLSISGVSGGGATESGSQTASITITDSDSAPTVTLSSSGSSVGEAESDLTLTATLSVATYQNVVVALTPTGTGTEGTDYATISDITVNAGATTGTTAFNPTDDSGAHEDTETAIVAITGVSGGGASENGTQSTTISIVENDAAPTVTLATSAASIAENAAGTLTLTATLSVATFENVTVALDPTGTATEGTDYGTISNITVSAGDTSGTATFDPTDDSKYESATAETSIVAITSVSGGNATESGTQTATISITENESAPTVTLATSGSTLDENSNSTLTLTATLSGTTYEDVTVALTPTGTATEGSDYETIADIVISEDATTGTTTFETKDDCITEGSTDETATVAITGVSGGGASESGTQSVALAIDDDEGAPVVTLASSATSITEGAGSITLTASLGLCSYTSDVVVSISTSGSATEGTDYTTIPDITISTGDTSATANFTPSADSLYDAASAESAVIDISGVSGGTASESGTQRVTLTINDSDSAPTVTLSSSASSVGEDASDLTLTATLSVATYQDVTVAIDGTGGTGTEGTDFATVSDITIDAGNTTGTTAFNPTPDDLFDAASAETGIIAISGVSGGGASESGSQSTTISIVDAESAPTVTLATNDTSLAEDDSDATLTATLSGKTYAAVTIDLSTSGTATEGTDYATISNITISAGATTGTAAFNPTDDSLYDAASAESATVAIGTVSGGSASAGSSNQSVAIAITDTESAPSVQLSSNANSIDEDSTSTITLTATLSGTTYENVVVSIGTSGDAGEGTDYSNVGDITISAGDTTGTTTFDPIDDCVIESGGETTTIAMSSFSGGGAVAHGSNQSKQLTITDDEGNPSITLAAASSSVAESGSDVTITAAIAGGCTASANITVNLSTSGTATDDTDYVLGDSITITAGQPSGTTALNPSTDSLYDAASAETAIIDISSVSGASAQESGTQQVTVSITDSNSAPTVTLATNDSSLAENDSDATLTATLSVATYAAVTVVIDTSGSATEGTDYASISNITVNAGATTGTTAFNPTDDSHYDAASAESATVSIGSVSGGSASAGSSNQSVAIAITDNESAPTVTLGTSANTVADSAADLTLTATLSHTTYAATTVDLDGSAGAATEGTDYATLSNITINANATTGTTAFNPTPSTSYEATETANVAIASVSGGGGAQEDGNQSVNISITQYSLNIGTAFVDNSSTYASQYAALNDYTIVHYDTGAGGAWHSSSSYIHPWTAMNIHKAWSYRDGSNNALSGAGENIAIMDGGYAFGFASSFTHGAFDNKKASNMISKYGTLNAATNGEGGSHGLAVSALAAGEFDGSGYGMGVAWGAGVHATENNSLANITAGTSDAANLSTPAIVQNNSWAWSTAGYCSSFSSNCSNQNIADMWTKGEFDWLKSNHGLSDDQGFAYLSTGNTANTSAWQSYISALNDFQDTGVIVFVSCNYHNDDDVCVMGALPEYYSQLAEAWLSVGWIEIEGSSITSSTVKRSTNTGGNKCGSAAQYCVVAPGGNYNIPNGSSSGSYNLAGNGSSYAAPVVSGSIALLAQAFPNHTPEQLVDRLLASANNSFFTVSGYTNFVNGIKHGYNDEFGHGIPDIYGALSPINSGTFSVPQIYTSGSLAGSLSLKDSGKSSNWNNGLAKFQSYNLTNTSLIQSASFGSSLTNALKNKKGYFYDSMNGGFEFEVSSMFSSIKTAALKSILLSDISRLSGFKKPKNKNYDFAFSNIMGSIGDKNSGLLSFNIDTPSAPIQFFNSLNNGSELHLASFNNPFTDNRKGGMGISYQEQIGDKQLLLGFHDSGSRSGLFGENEYTSKTFAASVSQSGGYFDNITVLAGLMIEEDTLLDSVGSGALGFYGSNPESVFMGVNFEKTFGDDLTLKFVATLGHSTLDNPRNSLIGSVSDIQSSSFNLILNKYNFLSENDRLSVSIGQPNKVESGSMVIRVPGLASSTGVIPYDNVKADLSPSGRQLDFGVDYIKQFNEDLVVGIKSTVSKDFNHISGADLNNTVTVTGSLKF